MADNNNFDVDDATGDIDPMSFLENERAPWSLHAEADLEADAAVLGTALEVHVIELEADLALLRKDFASLARDCSSVKGELSSIYRMLEKNSDMEMAREKDRLESKKISEFESKEVTRRLTEMQLALSTFMASCAPPSGPSAPVPPPSSSTPATSLASPDLAARAPQLSQISFQSPLGAPTPTPGARPTQRPSYSSINQSAASAPKVPFFDGTISAQFRPWLIQFETIARHAGWSSIDKTVRLVAALKGPAANLLIGMSIPQLEDYNCLSARLSRRYDPPEREEAHRAELRARTRRRNETADEFAENLTTLAQRAYPEAAQCMLDNLVVERFREGHGNADLKTHLCLYPSTGLQDLIGACVRFETHSDRARTHKPHEGLYHVNDTDGTPELTYAEVARAARKLGFGLRAWVNRQQDSPRTAPPPNVNDTPQQTRISQDKAPARAPLAQRKPVPREQLKCWTCGGMGHYASECKKEGPKFAFAPKQIRINYMQEITAQLESLEALEANDDEILNK